MNFRDFQISGIFSRNSPRTLILLLYIIEYQYLRGNTADRPRDTRKEIHPGRGASFLASRWCANPPMALLLERSLVCGFGLLGKKVYNFLKDKEYD